MLFEVGSKQIEAFHVFPWRQWARYYGKNKKNKEGIITFSAKNFSIKSLKPIEENDYPFTFLDCTIPLEERVATSRALIASLRTPQNLGRELQWFFDKLVEIDTIAGIEDAQYSFKILGLRSVAIEEPPVCFSSYYLIHIDLC